jgi:HTH-type transcriptional regulator/antitoxin HigA
LVVTADFEKAIVWIKLIGTHRDYDRIDAKDVKPIRSEADHAAALAEVERLWGAPSDTPEGDRLDISATLIDAYENEHHAIDPPDPIEAIEFHMEQQGLTRKDLEGILGTRTRVAEVLNRRRGLPIHLIRRLHETFGISAEVLIRPFSSTSPRPLAKLADTVRPV